ncbi:hypothetical protein LJC01_01785 [Clostridiaceae bacterium OttesenSCG-928-D20]|nr:hypothetical protein [Clostridiaceae bacterium OttesenSCG-928-D20]
MQSFFYDIRTFETDIYNQVSPAMLLRLCIDGTEQKAEAEGARGADMLQKLGAVWMISRLSLSQLKHINKGERLELQVTSRSIDKLTYTRDVAVISNGELKARAKLSFIAVSLEDRKILRPSAVEEGICHSTKPIELTHLKKIRAPELEHSGEYIVPYSLCDLNGHFSSANYAELICEQIGYWLDKNNAFSYLQIDYNAECKPLEKISLYTGCKAEESYMQGRHEDEKPAFTAQWKLFQI